MITRRAAAVALAASVLFGASACTSAEPDPTATPPFASEAEAFAAAEATYRAYVDALNDRRADGTSEPTDYLIGDALESDLDASRQLAAAGLTIVGETVVAAFAPKSYSRTDGVAASVCLDSSHTHVTDDQGNDVTPPDRDERSLLAVTFVVIGDHMAITSSTLEDTSC